MQSPKGADGNLRGDGQTAAPETHQQFTPTLCAFADTNLKAQQLLFPFRRCPYDHQHAFRVVFHAGLKINTVHWQAGDCLQSPRGGPDIDVAAA